MPSELTAPGVLQYRCRKCGRLDETTAVPDLPYALIYLAHGWPLPEAWGPVRPALIAVHDCGDGPYGIADLIGGRLESGPNDPREPPCSS